MNKESVLLSVLIDELDRNLRKQSIIKKELEKLPKGSLLVEIIHGDKYLYRKFRKKDKIISEYIGSIDSDNAKKAMNDRKKYLKIKNDLKALSEEEKMLSKILKKYD